MTRKEFTQLVTEGIEKVGYGLIADDLISFAEKVMDSLQFAYEVEDFISSIMGMMDENGQGERASKLRSLPESNLQWLYEGYQNDFLSMWDCAEAAASYII